KPTSPNSSLIFLNLIKAGLTFVNGPGSKPHGHRLQYLQRVNHPDPVSPAASFDLVPIELYNYGRIVYALEQYGYEWTWRFGNAFQTQDPDRSSGRPSDLPRRTLPPASPGRGLRSRHTSPGWTPGAGCPATA